MQSAVFGRVSVQLHFMHLYRTTQHRKENGYTSKPLSEVRTRDSCVRASRDGLWRWTAQNCKCYGPVPYVSQRSTAMLISIRASRQLCWSKTPAAVCVLSHGTAVAPKRRISSRLPSSSSSSSSSQVLQLVYGLDRLNHKPPSISIHGLSPPIPDSQPSCFPLHSIHLRLGLPTPSAFRHTQGDFPTR